MPSIMRSHIWQEGLRVASPRHLLTLPRCLSGISSAPAVHGLEDSGQKSYHEMLQFLLLFLLCHCTWGNLSSPTRDGTCAPCLTTGPPGESLCSFFKRRVMTHARAKEKRELDLVSSHLKSHKKSNHFH